MADTWTPDLEVKLRALKSLKFKHEVLTTRETTPVETINKELNRLLRNGLLPELNYCGSNRLGLAFIADYHIDIEHRPYLTRAFLESGTIRVEGRCAYRNVDDKARALNVAVCECVMFALHELERRAIPWPSQS